MGYINKDIMKKTFLILFIISTVLLIFFICVTLLDRSKITDIKNEIELKKDSIKKLKSFYSKDKFCFDGLGVKCVPYGPIIKLGDTMNIDVCFTVSEIATSDSPNEPLLILGKDVDLDKDTLNEPYDTLPVHDWLGRIKIKTSKLGKNKICGGFYYPLGNKKYKKYLFYTEFIVIDSIKTKK